MISKNWKYGVDESAVVADKGDRYPYIQSPEGERLWLADLDARQRALAERLVEAANLGNRLVGISSPKARVSRKISMPLTN
jgi:hypothetical protein